MLSSHLPLSSLISIFPHFCPPEPCVHFYFPLRATCPAHPDNSSLRSLLRPPPIFNQPKQTPQQKRNAAT